MSQDFSVFSEVNFDVKKWINNTLRSNRSNNNTEFEKQASSIRLSLQHLSTELSNNIEEISGQCLLRVPRALRDIELMKKDITTLSKKVNEFEIKLSKLEADSQDSVFLVAQLDDIKSKMETCANIISESEKYKILIKEIDKVFEGDEPEKISQVLSKFEKCVSTLKGIPEYSNSEQIMNKYIQKLENLIQPKLLSAFNQHSTDTAVKYVGILEQMGRKDQVLLQYYNCRLTPILQFWAEFDKKSQSFITWLPTFYDELQLLVNTELTWGSKVFSSHYSIVANLILKIHREIKESYNNRLKLEDFKLDKLIILYSQTKDFVSSLNFLESLPSDPNGQYGCTEKIVKTSILAPYFNFQNELFIRLIKEKLFYELSLIKPTLSDYFGTTAIIDNSVPKLFALCDNAVEQCIQFTESTELEALIEILKDLFKQYLLILNDLLKELRIMARLEPNLSSSKAGLSGSEESHFHDWGESYFQGALQFLEIVNKFTTRLENFDTRVKVTVQQKKRSIFTGDTLRDLNDISCYHISDFTKAQKLFSFFHLLDDITFKLLGQVHQDYGLFVVSVRSFVFDSMFNYIKLKLVPISNLPQWNQEFIGQIPEFSLTAQGYVKLVIEHLLNLRQLLEPYDTNEVMHITTKELLIQNAYYSVETWEEEQDLLQNPEPISETEREDSEGFASQWILAVARATVKMYIEQIYKIEKITNYGAVQLKVDILHLCNILNALGVKPDSTLNAILSILAAQNKEQFEKLPESSVRSIIGSKRGWVDLSSVM